MKFNLSTTENGKTVSQKRLDALAQWEKQRADGKWFWVFKRSAIWLTAAILFFGIANFLFPNQISLQGSQIFIGVFMFAGYILGLTQEWSKMEKTFRSRSFSGD